MDPDITFDPSILSPRQREYLQDKLRKVTGPPDVDGCTRFTGKARQGKLKTLGKIKTRGDISILFGKPDATINPAVLVYSLANNYVLRKSSEWTSSHLCGFGLCLNIEHIVFEPKYVNDQRRDHHKHQLCDDTHDAVSARPCIIKSYQPSYLYEICE